MQTGVPSTNASQSTLFINEIMSPTLDMFEINLDLQILSLHFSETIDIETFNITLITLQNRANGSTQSHTLTGGDNIVPDTSTLKS